MIFKGINQYVTHLHETSLMWRFLHVEFNKPLLVCRVQSVLSNWMKTRSQYYFSVQSFGIFKTAKTSYLKTHNNEKMAVKAK